MTGIWETNIAAVAVVTVLAVISPGPDFALTVRNATRHGRTAGLASALGISCGVGVHVAYTLLGLGYLVSTYAWVIEAVRFAGAGYLVWLGVSSFLPAGKDGARPCETRPGAGLGAAFRQGFLCNALNPKTVFFFIALFTQVADPDMPLRVQAGVGVFIALTHLCWFSVVVLAMTNPYSMRVFNSWRQRIEKIVGGCLIGLGTALALDS